MQTSKTVKKSGFKCPAFSVPSKTDDEGATSKKKVKTGASSNKSVKKQEAPTRPAKKVTDTGTAGDQSDESDVQVVPENTVNDRGDADTSDNGEKENDDDAVSNGQDTPANEIKDKTDALKPVVAKKKKKSEFKVSTKVSTDNKAASVGKAATSGEKAAEKKKKITKEKPEKKGKVAKDKKPAMPVISLTDEQYDEIFDAVQQYAENLDIDSWQPKITSPMKVREPKVKKFSITVGRKEKNVPESTKTVADKPDSKQKKVKDKAVVKDIAVANKGTNDDNNDSSSDVESVDDNKSEDVINVVDVQEESADSDSDKESIADQEQVADQNEAALHDDEVNLVQLENETTPAASVVNSDSEPEPTSVQPKKKIKSKKHAKLEPRKLPFGEEKKGPSMLDQVIEMKKKKSSKKFTEPTTVSTKQNMSEKLSTAETTKSSTKPSKVASKVRKHEDTNDRCKNKQKPVKRISKKKQMQEREVELYGTWVQCDNSTCLKWRYLAEQHDPSQVPDRWTCSMNKNKAYNSCSKPEESYDEADHIFTKFTEGSVVWARMTGYPWWPAMVEIDPDAEEYFSIESVDSMVPTHYHVVFFDERVSRCWVRSQFVKLYSGNEEEDGIFNPISKKGSSHSKEISAAKKNANRALICTLKERIELFGFACRYKGTWDTKQKNEIDKKKKRSQQKPMSKPSSSLDEALLDDCTMDEVLDNTDQLLDNVEEMLESLDSDLMNSDEDSDFAPDELVVVERKRKQKDHRANRQRKPESKRAKLLSSTESSPVRDASDVESDEDCRQAKTANTKQVKGNCKRQDKVSKKSNSKKLGLKRKGQTIDSSDGENDELPMDKETTTSVNAELEAEAKSEADSDQLDEEPTQEDTISGIPSKKDIPITKLNLDKEIFTMEMGSDTNSRKNERDSDASSCSDDCDGESDHEAMDTDAKGNTKVDDSDSDIDGEQEAEEDDFDDIKDCVSSSNDNHDASQAHNDDNSDAEHEVFNVGDDSEKGVGDNSGAKAGERKHTSGKVGHKKPKSSKISKDKSDNKDDIVDASNELEKPIKQKKKAKRSKDMHEQTSEAAAEEEASGEPQKKTTTKASKTKRSENEKSIQPKMKEKLLKSVSDKSETTETNVTEMEMNPVKSKTKKGKKGKGAALVKDVENNDNNIDSDKQKVETENMDTEWKTEIADSAANTKKINGLGKAQGENTGKKEKSTAKKRKAKCSEDNDDNFTDDAVKTPKGKSSKLKNSEEPSTVTKKPKTIKKDKKANHTKSTENCDDKKEIESTDQNEGDEVDKNTSQKSDKKVTTSKSCKKSSFKAPVTSESKKSAAKATEPQTESNKKTDAKGYLKKKGKQSDSEVMEIANEESTSEEQDGNDGRGSQSSEKANVSSKSKVTQFREESSSQDEMDLFEGLEVELGKKSQDSCVENLMDRKENSQDSKKSQSKNIIKDSTNNLAYSLSQKSMKSQENMFSQDSVKSQTQDNTMPSSVPSARSRNELNLGEISDSDTAEQSMYDDGPLVASGDKVRERQASPVPVVVATYSDEESDPFDLMEE